MNDTNVSTERKIPPIPTEKFTAPYKPIPVNDAMYAFPANVVGVMLPEWDDIPKDFQDWNGRNKWIKRADNWFCQGIENPPEAQEGFNKKEVYRHLSCCMRSFQPKHEHKIAGVAYLMSLWLTWREEESSEAEKSS
jgi:hypothetical protein